MLVLLCICSISGIAGAGTAPPIPIGPLDANLQPATPDYYTTANWANSPPLAKFVDTLPGLGSTKANNLGQYLSVAKPDIVTYPGSDYYEIELVEFNERMHSDLPLPGTKLRGYRQTNFGTDTSACGGQLQPPCDANFNTLVPDPVHQLGPTIIADRDRPVRIKFTNSLPTGSGGDLFIPVDTSVMGAGTGPAYMGTVRGDGTPCDNTIEPNTCASYTQNRAAVHLHGGRTPWISDGTPHQWITPVNEITPFTKGVSFQNVPDMPDPGDGSMTYYYTNQQSARLMFYHDHAFGITRLNVYAGEAAGYLITDQFEKDLVARGLIPADQIPLIIQDKTFVNAANTTKYLYNTATGLFDIPITVPTIRATDPLWNWGSGTPDINGVRPPVTGDLWLPHVYMPAQNPLAGSGGVNPFGRWMYGPWFYPATAVTKGPVANPYYDADCSSPFPADYANCSTPGQPPMIPGTPNVSMGMEAFQDSAVVNGTAFPSLTVDPRAYRFRILNAASDRFWNLSFYEADPAQPSPDTRLLATGKSNLTEVKTLPASANLAAANNWPADWPVDGRDGGVPDPALSGPSFFQIGTEGGFLPKPDIRVPQPVTYITDPTAFWVGVVDKTGLALGPAERADVIVDFSAYAGKTLILYNDAPAAWPARVPGYDYFTGAADMRDSGGYGTGGTFNPITGFWDGGTGPLVGYAPNTRTVMQIIVTGGTSGLPAVDAPYTFNQAALEAEFTSAAAPTALNPAPVKTLFERSQEPIIVGQTAYSSAYPNSYFPPNFPWEGINQINDHFLKFVTLAGQPVEMVTEPKGIHDEMGASFDPVYGRMSGNLAMQLPNPTTLNALLILYGFSDLPTETINNSTTVDVQVLGSVPTPIPWQVTDGTQIWKISHNGVDTHPIHFHIFDVQLINRVGWDGQIALPEANELGWKDTVKISPLMDTIVAVRPRAPALPFGITNSLRPLNPAIPIGSPMGFNNVDWQTGQARPTPVTNILYDFAWEYVWHCHILSHEEMDMMRPIVLNVTSVVPDTVTGLNTPATFTGGVVTLNWTDPTPALDVATPGNPKNEIGFRIERCAGLNCVNFAPVGTALANATSYTETVLSSDRYSYRVIAYNAAGESAAPTFVTTQSFDIIDGVCGTSNGQLFAAIPTTGLCASGTESVVTNNFGILTWSCNGINSTINDVCSATIPTYSVNFIAGANGTVNGTVSVSQTVTYSLDATTVTAAPITGYHFVNWTEGATVVSTTPALTVTNVLANHTYTANFAIDTFTVDFVAGPNGTLTGTTSQVVNYFTNATTVTAVPNLPGYHFVNWTEGATVVSTTAALTVNNVTANHIYTANFAIDTFAVNYAVATGEHGTLTFGTSTGLPLVNQTVNYGANAVTVSAIPDVNYHFVNWMEGATEVSLLPDLTITNVTAAHNYTAHFALTSYAVSLDQCVTGPTIVSSGDMPTYNFNTNGFDVTAQINGTPIVLTGSSYTYSTGVTGNQVITATYTVNPVGTTAAARIVRGATTLDFATLQAAYTAAQDGETIMLKGGTQAGSLNLNRPISVTLKGGYDASYTANCSFTTVGAITFGGGSVTFDRVSL
ncbi:MAG: multicopper oxidase domain-containing protein [Geobacteraceae bacterium]|nr:multicopper oxidase domain-containing protein [Geobacteraceae bacterium]